MVMLEDEDLKHHDLVPINVMDQINLSISKKRSFLYLFKRQIEKSVPNVKKILKLMRDNS